MQRLFIIGNGFDRAHSLPTGYDDFQKFLLDNHPNADTEWPAVPQSGIGHHGEVLYDDDEVAGFWVRAFSEICGDTWQDLESALGELDFLDELDTLPEMFDREGDRDMGKEMANNEDLMSEIVGALPYVSQWFSEWIDSIDLGLVRPLRKFRDLLHAKEDLFLSFNYTQVLERIYGIPSENICHIHGVQGEDLMFGHGAGPLLEEEYVGPYPGSEYGREYIHDALRKDTQGALLRHQAFFERLSAGIDTVFSFGFSYGEVDQVYLREICAQTDTSHMTWYLHDFDKKKHPAYQKALAMCGFKGSFECFST